MAVLKGITSLYRAGEEKPIGRYEGTITFEERFLRDSLLFLLEKRGASFIFRSPMVVALTVFHEHLN